MITKMSSTPKRHSNHDVPGPDTDAEQEEGDDGTDVVDGETNVKTEAERGTEGQSNDYHACY